MITLRWISSVWREWFKEETYILFILTWPVATTYLLHSLVPLTSLAFVGHVSRDKSKLLIDAIALGVSFINVTGYAVIFGLTSATETLCSQAYGAKNYRRVGIILQKSVLICSMALFPVIVIFLNAESVLLILYQSPCVARLTGKFCKIIAIGLPALYLEVIAVKYLQSQGVVKPTVITAMLSNITNVTGLVLLLYVAKMEIEGAAIVTASTSFVLLSSITFYMFMRKPDNKTWQGVSWESLKEWKEFLCLAIPGLFMVCGEWWILDIGIFVTGNVSGAQLAAYNITLNLLTSGFVIPFGIGVAVAIRVGNMLGAGKPDKAKKAAIVAVCFTILWCSLEMIVLLSYRNIGEIFTTDKDVIDTTGKLTFLGSFFAYSDSLQAVLSGVLRGCGKQLPVAVINICCYYLLGLPVSLALVYAADMGAFGFWIGCTISSVIQVMCLLILVFRTNFSLESQKAQIKAGALVKISQAIDNSISDKKEIVNEEVPSDNDDIEMTTLINGKEQDEASGSDEDIDNKRVTSRTSSHVIKLLLIRTPWYIIGLVVLVTGVVLSQYRIHLPYEAQCDDMYNDNLTNSTTVAISYS